MIDDAVLALDPWTLEFHSSVAKLYTCVVWMRLPELPSSLWTRSAIDLIVSKISKLVCLDQSTELLSKRRFARVTIELDGLSVPSFWQSFQ